MPVTHAEVPGKDLKRENVCPIVSELLLRLHRPILTCLFQANGSRILPFDEAESGANAAAGSS